MFVFKLLQFGEIRYKYNIPNSRYMILLPDHIPNSWFLACQQWHILNKHSKIGGTDWSLIEIILHFGKFVANVYQHYEMDEKRATPEQLLFGCYFVLNSRQVNHPPSTLNFMRCLYIFNLLEGGIAGVSHYRMRPITDIMCWLFDSICFVQIIENSFNLIIMWVWLWSKIRAGCVSCKVEILLTEEFIVSECIIERW